MTIVFFAANKLNEKENQPNPAVLDYYLEAFYQSKQYDKAIENIEQALTLSPNNVNYYVSAGLVYELAGNRLEALQWIKKALDNGIPVNRIINTTEFDSLIKDPEMTRYLTTGKDINQ